jgi:hypothetical protein
MLKPGAVAANITVPVPHLDADVVVGADGAMPKVPTTDTLVADIQPVISFLLCT